MTPLSTFLYKSELQPLNGPIYRNEVFGLLKDCNLGPDRFSWDFCKLFQDILVYSLLDMLKDNSGKCSYVFELTEKCLLYKM